MHLGVRLFCPYTLEVNATCKYPVAVLCLCGDLLVVMDLCDDDDDDENWGGAIEESSDT